MIEVDYTQTDELFAIEIECKMCGENSATMLFDESNRVIILKCGNKRCEAEDYIFLL